MFEKARLQRFARAVKRRERGTKRQETTTQEQIARQDLLDFAREIDLIERLIDQFAKNIRAEIPERGIDRCDASAMDRAFDPFATRIEQLEAAARGATRGAERTVKQVLRLGLCLIGKVGALKPEHGNLARIVFDEAADELHSAPRSDALKAYQAPAESERARSLVRRRRERIRNRRDDAAIFITKREMSEEVGDGRKTRRGECARTRRADARKCRERREELDAQGTSSRSKTTPKRISSVGFNSCGMPVSSRVPFKKVAFIVPISSERKNFEPRR